MEHNQLMELEDDTVITYSDIKQKINGQEYITIYFETPSEKYGFCSMDMDYPDGKPSNIVGYTDDDIKRLLYHYEKVSPLAFEDAKEEYEGK